MRNDRRALVVATVAGFFSHMRTVRGVLEGLGYTVDAAANYDSQSCIRAEQSAMAGVI